MEKTKQKKAIKNKAKIVKKPLKKVEKRAENEQKITPLGSWVLIKPFTKEELEQKNSFGIILPNTDAKEKSERGVVLAVGSGRVQDGKHIPMTVKVGQMVAYSRYGFEDITVDGEELYLIKEENILAILK